MELLGYLILGISFVFKFLFQIALHIWNGFLDNWLTWLSLVFLCQILEKLTKDIAGLAHQTELLRQHDYQELSNRINDIHHRVNDLKN